MKKLFGAALLASVASVAMTSAAHAEISGNIALTTDYVFRGVSLSDNSYAIQGGFDWSQDIWYAGVWGSSLSEGAELDLYGGVTPSTGPVDWDFGIIGYFYPGANDDDAEFDYYELKAGASISPIDKWTFGATVYYSPENYGDTGDARYVEATAAFAPTEQLSFDAAFGNQQVENPDGAPGGADEDDYNTWNIGGTYALHGFSLDLRYTDTDIDEGSDIEAYTYGPTSYDSNVVFTISREL